MNIIPLQCSNFKECGKTVARVQLKVCSRCKQARYCSPQCQKAHWRTEHKKECEVVGLAPAKDIALKLVERLLAAPNLTRYFYFHSILTLDLIQNRLNASHYAVKVECDTQVADLAAHLRRMMAGQARDPTAQVLLCVTEISRVPMDEAPERTRIAAADATKRFEVAKEEEFHNQGGWRN
ncbi:hypothetical protein SERLADRAFT_463000 [Serpula lacrymans var. lacrymans S7.9]|uniref:MYND-type domain-containing protein n=1 Tax=Serpula lacrymans var. lacrymans (strain S7.9) TaxID=578457 RepID=F8NR27_SERL9|nr:uncharacterized protein SERLADRAFT_463000 [Serpula lacrymans var. lacrymans S7.9]EGO26200.1 hypothetical protein SERLADRAFT_463000 [Serpula lacrymans var. lacrymans S7.9]